MTKTKTASDHPLMRALGRCARLFVCALALALVPASPALAAVTCTVGAVTLNYGAYDVLAGAELNGTGTIEVTCSNTSTKTDRTVTYTLKLTPAPSSGRLLAPASGTDRLSHQLYLDSSRSGTPWGDGTSSTTTLVASFSVPKRNVPKTSTQYVYAKVTPGGQDVAATNSPATYAQNFIITMTCAVTPTTTLTC